MKKTWLVCFLFLFTPVTFAQPTNAEKVYRLTSPSIYVVKNVDAKTQRSFQGSAVAVDKNFLATNCHLVYAGNNFSVIINNKPKYAWVFYNKGDLCLVKVAGTQFTPVKMRLTKTVQIGEEAYVVSNPEGFTKTISNGIISNAFADRDGVFLQTTANISPGSSGGGLFDKDGNLIGIIFLKYEEPGAEGLNFAFPTESIINRAVDPSSATSSTSDSISDKG